MDSLFSRPFNEKMTGLLREGERERERERERKNANIPFVSSGYPKCRHFNSRGNKM